MFARTEIGMATGLNYASLTFESKGPLSSAEVGAVMTRLDEARQILDRVPNYDEES